LNYTSPANDCGIGHNTARSWISILEASFIVSILPPYYENFNKGLVKPPKLYFLDTGLMCHLPGIHNVGHYSAHPLKEAVFQTFVFSELVKLFLHKGHRKEMYNWRERLYTPISFGTSISGRASGAVPIVTFFITENQNRSAGQPMSSRFSKGLNH